MDLNEEDDNVLQPDSTGKMKVRLRTPMVVPNLKEIATLNVAVALWNHVNIPRIITRFGFDRLLISDLREASQWTDELSIPRSLAEKIDEFANKVLEEVNAWVTYHYRQVFFKHKNAHSLYCLMYFFAWYPDGTIDYEETARNLSSSVRLSEVEKYHLLCTFCMKDEIERIPPSVYANNVLDYVSFSDHPLIFYWNCYCRKELHKLGSYPDFVVIRKESVDNWPAIEYFFDRLIYGDQVQIANWLIDRHGIKFQKLVLMKLNEAQRIHVYSDMNRGVKIMMNFMKSIEINYQDILTTWLEIRNTITRNQFNGLFAELLKVTTCGTILTEIWTSACDYFKNNFLHNFADFDVMKKLLQFWLCDHDDDFFFIMIATASENLKESLAKRRFFTEACEELVSNDELKSLDKLLSSCLTNAEEVFLLKRDVIKEDFFGNSFVTSMAGGELHALEQLFDSFVCNVKESVRFRRGFLTNPKFVERYNRLAATCELKSLERFFKVCFTNVEDSAKFKQALVKTQFFSEWCKKLLIECEAVKLERLLYLCFADHQELLRFKRDFTSNEFFVQICAKLMTEEKLLVLERLLRVFISETPDRIRFKEGLTVMEFFKSHCEKLACLEQFSKIDELLSWCFRCAGKVANFKRNFVLSSTWVKHQCLGLYSSGKLHQINTLLNRFLSPYPQVVVEYKKNLLMSSDCLEKSVHVFDQSDVLNRIIVESFVPADFAAELREKIAFSTPFIRKLQNMIQENRFNVVKKLIDEFFSSDDDKQALKKRLLDDSVHLMGRIFRVYDESGWQMVMKWCLRDGKLVQEFKSTLPLDEVFDEVLKYCVFRRYSEDHLLKGCIFQKVVTFDSVDRFLNWYFLTASERKRYKLLRINAYMSIDIIRTLIKKKDLSYLRAVMYWFLDGDDEEIIKFKTNNRGRTVLRVF